MGEGGGSKNTSIKNSNEYAFIFFNWYEKFICENLVSVILQKD